MSAGALNDETMARVVLAKLNGAGPARLRWLLADHPATAVVAALRQGRLPADTRAAPPGVSADVVDRWVKDLRTLDPIEMAAELDRRHVTVLTPLLAGWPFDDDPDPPVVVFVQGALELLAPSPRVALVGTRRCSAIGRQVAYRFGAELAEAGVTVVSGLALGIDGAAHSGALAAGGRPLAVVGSGLDVIYPRANRGLWGQVVEAGLIMSEAPLGAKGQRWRFPARNRLLAALADVTVVVESHASGGALLTAIEAADRGRPVLAVPGAVTSPASDGSNRLLVDGCAPACTTADILDLLPQLPPPPGEVAGRSPGSGRARGRGRGSSGRPRSDPSLPFPGGPSSSALGRLVLAEVSAGATHMDVLVAASGAPVAEVLAEVHRLRAAGLVELDGSTVHCA